MSKTKRVRVYPVEGRFILGFPHIEQEATEAEAEALVATGAFTTSPPQAVEAAEPPTIEVTD